jgi:hypothetical protein
MGLVWRDQRMGWRPPKSAHIGFYSASRTFLQCQRSLTVSIILRANQNDQELYLACCEFWRGLEDDG